MTTNRWSLSRVWGNPSEPRSTPSASSSTLGTSSTGRSNQSGSSQRDQKRPSTGTRATTTSRPRPAQIRIEEEPQYSTPAVADSLWFASDFMVGAGMVIIQPSSGKVVVLGEKYQLDDGRVYIYYFLPKGRKDVGESLEQTALREAYEESGFRASFLPVILPHNAPEAPGSIGKLDHRRLLPCTEPIFISTLAYENRQGGRNRRGGEYLTFWYVGQIPEDAVFESGTRMADEVAFETYLIPIADALSVLEGKQKKIVHMAYALWEDTVERQSRPEYKHDVAKLEAEYARSTAPVGVPVDTTSTGHGSGPSGSQETVSAEQDTEDSSVDSHSSEWYSDGSSDRH